MKTRINSLSEDTIVDILSRLPAKSIGRCRCVSRQWRCLLSQPHFINTHIRRPCNTQQSLLFRLESGAWYYATLEDAHQVFGVMSLIPTELGFANLPKRWLRMVVSCDGLVLVESIHMLILLNPVTREVKEIPFYEDHLRDAIYGLGYDSVNHDYKIVTLVQYSDKVDSLAKVYSVRNGSWKTLEKRPQDRTRGNGVFINGYIHWFVYRNKYIILLFDLAKEKFHEALLPDSISNDMLYGYVSGLGILGGCLCVFHSTYCGDNRAWIMNEYGSNESWTKLAFVHPGGGYFEPCMSDQEQMLVECVYGYPRKLFKYSLKDGIFKEIVIVGIDWNIAYVEGTFVESLVSPYCTHETS